MAKQLKGTLGSWVLDIKETVKLADKQILVFYDSKAKKKVYTRLMPEKDLEKGLFFEILSASELEGIVETVEIEESYNKTLESKSSKEIYIEESESTEDTDKIKKETEEWMEEQKKKQASSVTINIHGGKPKGSEDSKFPIDTQDVETTRQIIELGRQKLEQKYGVSLPDIENLEQLQNYKTMLEQVSEKSKPKETPSGVAPLSPSQYGKEPQKKGYDSIEDMIMDLRARERSGEQEAHEILNELMRKSFKGLGKLNMPIKEYSTERQSEFLDDVQKSEKQRQIELIEDLPKRKRKTPHPHSAIRTEVER